MRACYSTSRSHKATHLNWCPNRKEMVGLFYTIHQMKLLIRYHKFWAVTDSQFVYLALRADVASLPNTLKSYVVMLRELYDFRSIKATSHQNISDMNTRFVKFDQAYENDDVTVDDTRLYIESSEKSERM